MIRLAEANGGLPRTGLIEEPGAWAALSRIATLAAMLVALLFGFKPPEPGERGAPARRRDGKMREGRDRSRPSLFAAEPPPVLWLYATACAGTADGCVPGCRPSAGPYRQSRSAAQHA